MTKKFKDTITITEKDNSINININMESLTPCVNAIKQYNPSFKAKDIINESRYFKGSLTESIIEYYNELLYGAIEHQQDDKRHHNDTNEDTNYMEMLQAGRIEYE